MKLFPFFGTHTVGTMVYSASCENEASRCSAVRGPASSTNSSRKDLIVTRLGLFTLGIGSQHVLPPQTARSRGKQLAVSAESDVFEKNKNQEIDVNYLLRLCSTLSNPCHFG